MTQHRGVVVGEIEGKVLIRFDGDGEEPVCPHRVGGEVGIDIVFADRGGDGKFAVDIGGGELDCAVEGEIGDAVDGMGLEDLVGFGQIHFSGMMLHKSVDLIDHFLIVGVILAGMFFDPAMPFSDFALKDGGDTIAGNGAADQGDVEATDDAGGSVASGEPGAAGDGSVRQFGIIGREHGAGSGFGEWGARRLAGEFGGFLHPGAGIVAIAEKDDGIFDTGLGGIGKEDDVGGSFDRCVADLGDDVCAADIGLFGGAIGIDLENKNPGVPFGQSVGQIFEFGVVVHVLPCILETDEFQTHGDFLSKDDGFIGFNKVCNSDTKIRQRSGKAGQKHDRQLHGRFHFRGEMQ